MTVMVFAFAWLTTASLAWGSSPNHENEIGTTDYRGYKWIKFNATHANAEWLEDMQQYGFDIDEFDPWAEVLIAPEFFKVFLSLLSQKNIHQIEILDDDYQSVIDSESRAIEERLRRKKRELHEYTDSGGFDVENYNNYDKMVAFMRDLVIRYPSIASLHEIGRSFEGRIIYGIKPAIVLDAGIHAREWIAPAAAIFIINKLANSYGKDDVFTRAVDTFEWYIIPQLNPDGYEYSLNADRLWRKTRSRNATANKWCVGTDANRNWGYRWGEAGANRSPCSNIYQGAYPFSEPEIVGLKEFLTWKIPDLVIYLSLHAYGQVFLSPWGYTNQRPANYIHQRNAARAAVAAMKKATGAVYSYGTISEVMYPASGTSIDFMQSRDVPYIYGVELRPTDTQGSYAFSIPPTNIKPTGDELLAGTLAIADYFLLHPQGKLRL